MKWESIEQILKVITAAAQRFRQGDGIDYSYHQAVNRVSQEYNITYQTIGDACRRRLAESTIRSKQPDTFVTYTVQLRKGDSDVLKALSQLLGNPPEEILVKAAVEGIKERMKIAVNQL